MEIREKNLEIATDFVLNHNSNLCYLVAPDNLCENLKFCISDDWNIIDLKNNYSPFKPFLQITSDYKPTSELLQKYCYEVQRETFRSYFERGIAIERYDVPIENENLYETNRFISTICNLIKELNTKNFLILNAQMIHSDTVELLKVLEKTEHDGKFVLCFNSDESYDISKNELEFLEQSHDKINFLRLKENFSKTASLLQKKKRTMDTESMDYNSILHVLRNNRLFMANEQLQIITNLISKNFLHFQLSPEEAHVIHCEIALAFYACGQLDDCILHLNEVVNDKINDEYKIAAYHYLTKVFYYKKSHDFAIKYFLRSQELTHNEPNSPYIALNAMLEYQFMERTDLGEIISKYTHALDLLERQGFVNNYISTGLSIPWKLINEQSSRFLIDSNIQKCYELAKKIDNQHLVSKACHWKGIMHSHYGEDKESIKWYDECNRIRTQIGEIGPLMNIRNGLSYESLCRAKYENAYNLVNGVVKNLYSIDDYSASIDTLKNLSYALFYSRHFLQAYTVLNKILHYMKIFEMEYQTNNSFLPTMNDILLFKTIIDLSWGDYIHSKTNYMAIYSVPDTVTSEDRPLIFFIQASLWLFDKNIKEAEKSMETCINMLKEIKRDQSHKIVFCCYEFALALEKEGFEEESRKYMDKGFQLAKDKGFTYFSLNRSSITTEDYLQNIPKFEPLNIDLAFLDEKTEKEVLVTQLHKRLYDYQFLNKIKTNDIMTTSLQQYIEDSANTIFEYSMAKGVYVCELTNGKYQTIFSISRNDEANFSENKWKKLFTRFSKESSCEMEFYARENLFFSNISKFEYNFGIALVQSPKTPFSPEVISAINIALFTIQSQITIYKQNENLIFLSSTDQLSLLKNKHSLTEFLSIESEKLRRANKKNIEMPQISIAFIDLDNFKYYNDHFGHPVGDLVIKLFAKLLKNTYRSVDFVSRYGGDEFVIVMNDSNVMDGARVYQRLLDNLKAEEYFLPEIRKFLKKTDLEVQDNLKIGFSMGISSNIDNRDSSDLNLTLANADKALYHSKENKKGCCTVWSSIRNHP